MNKARRPRAIRVGDRVRIVNPQIFVRCGYPLCLDELVDEVPDEVVMDAMRAVGIHVAVSPPDLGPPLLSQGTYRAIERVKRGLALALAEARGWGGARRSIYTESRPEITGIEARVLYRRRVITGVREPGAPPSSSFPYDDYWPPYLSNFRVHVILGIEPLPMTTLASNVTEIESCHVERIEDKETP